MEDLLSDYGLAIDVGMVVVIVVMIQLIKKPIKKRYNGLMPAVPVICSFVVTILMSDEIHWMGHDHLHEHTSHTFLHIAKEVITETLLYTAGAYILYNVILERFLKKDPGAKNPPNNQG